MIVLAAAMLMAGNAAMPAAPSRERNALGTCLAKVVHDKLMDNMDVAAFKAAAHSACAAEETAFRNAWVNYDVAMKTRRPVTFFRTVSRCRRGRASPRWAGHGCIGRYGG